MNNATAGGILGGKVQVSVVSGPANSGDGTCEFTRESGAAMLRIQIKTMANWRAEYPPFVSQCGPNPTVLRGIGTEAVGCSGTAKDGKLYHQILSRIRERSLLIRVASSDQQAAPALSEQARKAGEMVAGFLF